MLFNNYSLPKFLRKLKTSVLELIGWVHLIQYVINPLAEFKRDLWDIFYILPDIYAKALESAVVAFPSYLIIC
jgi:hypothetical protein